MGFGVVSLDSLVQFDSLRGLSIAGMYHSGSQPDHQDTVSDFSALAELHSLVDLSVDDCRFFDDDALLCVTRIPNLREFTLSSFMNTVADITVLSRAKQLVKLDIAGYAKWHFSHSFWSNLFRGYHCELDRQIQELRIALPNCEIVASA